MVHGAGEVLVENERHSAGFAEASIGEADAVGLDELRRRGLVVMYHFWAAMKHFWAGMNHDGRTSITQPARHRTRAPVLLSRSQCHSAPWAPRSPRSRRQSLRPPWWESLRRTPPRAQAWEGQPKATGRAG